MYKRQDKNGDGTIQYVMLQGEPGHQDATLRTEYSVKAIEEAGFKTEKLAADTAMWDKAKATDPVSYTHLDVYKRQLSHQVMLSVHPQSIASAALLVPLRS